MYAKEVEDRKRYEYERVLLVLAKCIAISDRQVFHRHRRQMRRRGLEANADSAVGVPLDDVVVDLLPLATSRRHVAGERLVKLQHDVRRETHVAGRFVDET